MTLQLIGAGLGRTGTASLRHALRLLGLRCYHMYDIIFDRARRDDATFWASLRHEQPCGGAGPDWQSIFRDYRATLDYPACFYWRELMMAYPAAKVILTTHPRGAEAWYDSTAETIFTEGSSSGASPFGQAMVDMLERQVWGPEGFFQGRFKDRDFAIARYEDHAAAVRAGVPADRLIEFEVTEGWAPICTALGLPVPDKPFPRLNEREDKAKVVSRLKRMEAFGLGRRKAQTPPETNKADQPTKTPPRVI